MKQYSSIQICFVVSLLIAIKSTAYSQWVRTDIPIEANTTCFVINGTTLFAGTLDSGIYISNDDGKHWTKSGLTDWNFYALAVVGTNLFAGVGSGFGNGAVLVSTNNGLDWASTPNASTVVLCFAVQWLNLFAGTGTGSGVELTTDDGATWKSVNTGLNGNTIQCLASSGSNLFAGTDQGMFLSTNNGSNWKAVNHGLSTMYIYSLAVGDSNILVGTYPDGVFLSTNNGSNWNAVNNGLKGYKNILLNAITVNNNNFFVGTDSGIFISSNNGASWNDVSTGLGNDTVTALAVINSNLYASTSQGTWRRALSEMISTGSVSTDEQSSIFSLKSYPNPFKDRTTMSYVIPTHEHVRMILSNILGDQLQTLVDKDVDAGVHNLTIKADDLSNGVYTVSIFAGGMSKEQKICVQK